MSEGGGVAIWLTGLPASGKTTIAQAAASRLRDFGARVEVLDGDEVRKVLSAGLGFSRSDREANVERIAWVAGLLVRCGVIVLVAAISPFRGGRDKAREAIGAFVEVHVSTPLAVCEARDPKGLYARARRGELAEMTGVGQVYEEPLYPELRIDTSVMNIEDAVCEIMAAAGYSLERRLELVAQAAERAGL